MQSAVLNCYITTVLLFYSWEEIFTNFTNFETIVKIKLQFPTISMSCIYYKANFGFSYVHAATVDCIKTTHLIPTNYIVVLVFMYVDVCKFSYLNHYHGLAMMYH